MYLGSKVGLIFQWKTKSASVGTYFEDNGAVNDFSLNLGISPRCLLRHTNFPVKINKIIIPNIKKYDKRDFMFYCLSICVLYEL